MRQNIKNFNTHAQPEKLKEYVMDAPEGTWTARLDDHAWGKSQNLFVFFTDAATDKKYRLSVFQNKLYKPAKDGPAFDEEPAGGLYELTTGKSKNGLPSFLSARKL
jgi:hypothetical protein